MVVAPRSDQGLFYGVAIDGDRIDSSFVIHCWRQRERVFRANLGLELVPQDSAMVAYEVCTMVEQSKTSMIDVELSQPVPELATHVPGLLIRDRRDVDEGRNQDGGRFDFDLGTR